MTEKDKTYKVLHIFVTEAACAIALLASLLLESTVLNTAAECLHAHHLLPAERKNPPCSNILKQLANEAKMYVEKKSILIAYIQIIVIHRFYNGAFRRNLSTQKCLT